MSAREIDQNGFLEIKSNPLSKVGVFPYYGRSIGLEGLEADEIYMVYRPEEELADQECIDSFKLIPWIDEHEMLGSGFTPAEQKGVAGTTGEDIYFDDGYLKGNIRLFSEGLFDSIQSGKKELSCGYRCKYELAIGEFEGQSYDVIQKDIRGNHLALVQEGRMGPEVAVLDKSEQIALDHYNITLDENGSSVMEKDKKTGEDEVSLADLVELVGDMKKVMDGYAKDMEALKASMKKGEDADPDKDKGEDQDPDKDKGEDMDPEKDKGEDKAQDAKIAAMAVFVGTFDHAEMTSQEVAKYALDKLEIECEEGEELATLKGFLHSRTKESVVSLDSKDHKVPADSQVSEYLGGKS